MQPFVHVPFVIRLYQDPWIELQNPALENDQIDTVLTSAIRTNPNIFAFFSRAQTFIYDKFANDAGDLSAMVRQLWHWTDDQTKDEWSWFLKWMKEIFSKIHTDLPERTEASAKQRIRILRRRFLEVDSLCKDFLVYMEAVRDMDPKGRVWTIQQKLKGESCFLCSNCL
jgi:hypothetical protein